MTQCKEIMIENPSFCLADDNVSTIAQRMDSERTNAFLVVVDYNKKKLIGIVTDNDIALRVVGKGLKVEVTEVRDIMSTNLHTCYPHDDLDATLKKMDIANFRRVPVVNLDREVQGIIMQARMIQARVSVRVDSENQVTAMTIKDSFSGWSDFANRLPSVLKRMAHLNMLTDTLTNQDDTRFTASSTC